MELAIYLEVIHHVLYLESDVMTNLKCMLRELITLPRPHLFPIPAAAGVCGLYLSSSLSINFFKVLAASVIPILVWCGGQVLNDLFDSEFDKIYHPEWPIPSGLISKNLAFGYGLMFYVVATLFAFHISVYCLGATIVAILFATAYNNLKRKGIYGNICFGVAVASCILIGATVSRNIPHLVLYVMCISILLHTADNIIGTFPDMEADKRMGFETLPLQRGPKFSAFISFLLILISSLITLSLWLAGLKISYLPVAFVAVTSLLWTSLLVLRNPLKFCKLKGFWIVYSFFMGEILLYMSLIIG